MFRKVLAVALCATSAFALDKCVERNGTLTNVGKTNQYQAASGTQQSVVYHSYNPVSGIRQSIFLMSDMQSLISRFPKEVKDWLGNEKAYFILNIQPYNIPPFNMVEHILDKEAWKNHFENKFNKPQKELDRLPPLYEKETDKKKKQELKEKIDKWQKEKAAFDTDEKRNKYKKNYIEGEIKKLVYPILRPQYLFSGNLPNDHKEAVSLAYKIKAHQFQNDGRIFKNSHQDQEVSVTIHNDGKAINNIKSANAKIEDATKHKKAIKKQMELISSPNNLHLLRVKEGKTCTIKHENIDILVPNIANTERDELIWMGIENLSKDKDVKENFIKSFGKEKGGELWENYRQKFSVEAKAPHKFVMATLFVSDQRMYQVSEHLGKKTGGIKNALRTLPLGDDITPGYKKLLKDLLDGFTQDKEIFPDN